MGTTIFQPFSKTIFKDIQAHVAQVRRLYDWPGIAYHDADQPENTPHQTVEGASVGSKFNRWYWHRPPVLHKLHHSADLIKKVSNICGVEMKPSYVFLSMYGPEGACPLHQDRPQCQFTVDLQVNSDGTWPIYVDGKSYELENGEALAYSGTNQPHYRKEMRETGKFIETAEGPRIVGKCTYMDLAFFHFVPTNFMGKID